MRTPPNLNHIKQIIVYFMCTTPTGPDFESKIDKLAKDIHGLFGKGFEPDPNKYLIESVEHSVGNHIFWWKPARLGYTRDIDFAGRYSLDEARAICRDANITGTNERFWSEVEVYSGMIGPVARTVAR